MEIRDLFVFLFIYLFRVIFFVLCVLLAIPKKKKVSTHRILLSSNKEKRSTPRLTYGEVIQHILTSASDSVEENPFNSNDTFGRGGY